MTAFYIRASMTPVERLNHAKRFLSAYGESHHVEFIFDEQPKTDGKTVWLGKLNPEDPNFIPRALAHGMHEMLHVTDTDLTEYQKAAGNALSATLINVLEDVRIDSLGMRRYPGYKVWRAELTELLEASGALKPAADPRKLSTLELTSVWLHAELLDAVGVAWAQRYRLRLRSALLERIPAKTAEAILRAAEKIHKAQSTKDARLITEKILAIIKKAKIEGETADLFDSEGKAEISSEGIEALKKAAKKLLTASLPFGPESDVQIGGASQEKSSDTFSPALWPEETDDKQLLDDKRLYTEKFLANSAVLQRLTQEFRNILKSDATELRAARSGTALVPDFAIRAGMKEERIFLKELSAKRPAADVIVLLDRSGSMGVERMTKAKIAVASLIKALSTLKEVTTTCAVFPGPNRKPLAIAKTEKETVDTFLRRFAGIGAFGSTPFVEASSWAIANLKTSTQKNRLLFVITDGLFRAENAERLREELERNRIEAAVLNIDTNNPPICDNTVNVTETAEIAKGLLKLVRATGFAEKLHRGN